MVATMRRTPCLFINGPGAMGAFDLRLRCCCRLRAEGFVAEKLNGEAEKLGRTTRQVGDFGEERLIAALKEHHGCPASEAMEATVREEQERVGPQPGDQADDLTDQDSRPRCIGLRNVAAVSQRVLAAPVAASVIGRLPHGSAASSWALGDVPSGRRPGPLS